MTEAEKRYQIWADSPLVDDRTKAELAAIAGDPDQITDRFYQQLSFGTAGLRGVLGAGDNRMNVYNVRKATEGLARFLKEICDAPRVCIAFDSRLDSDVFARETACVLAAHGIQVYLYRTLHSVPQLSFSVRRLRCTAGVVITASHNPAKYNGYKVYWSHGGQVAPREAAAIMDRIAQVPDFQTAYLPYDAAVASGAIALIGEEIDEAYYASIRTLLLHPDILEKEGGRLSIVYTPLHGTGYVPVTTVLDRIGVKNVAVVPEQAKPDSAFPTVPAPNPEMPEAFTLAKSLATARGANVILATDPDADRLGVAVLDGAGQWRVLTGNQIGCLLLHYLLSEKSASGTLPPNGLVVKSFVSSRLADAIAARYGVAMAEVMTGFRFISEQIDLCQKTGAHTFLFGFEESYGFLAGGFSRDKDAILSAMLMAEACVVYASRGKSLCQVLEEIYDAYGHFVERSLSYTLEGKAGLDKIAGAMRLLRQTPPAAFAGNRVAQADDYQKPELTGLPAANALRFTLDNGAWVIARPSGTEPKLKLYIGVRGETAAEAEQLSDALYADVDRTVGQLLRG